MYPFERFTERAKKVLTLAQEEAERSHHSYIGTEHLLLGLLREEKGIAAQVLTDAGVNLDAARAETLRILGTEIPLPPHSPDATLVFAESNGRWTCEGPLNEVTLTGKRPGLQGPIDDAFATPFLCVRGTGQPWNSEVNAWARSEIGSDFFFSQSM